MGKIKVFKSIAELHEANGVRIKQPLSDFIVFSFEQTYPSAKQYMPPYKKLFNQIVLFEEGLAAEFRLNQQRIKDPGNLIYFNGLGHVYSYRRGQNQKGYIIYFTNEFVHSAFPNLGTEFPFFKVTESNILRLSTNQLAFMSSLFKLAHQEHNHEKPNREVLLSLLSSILLKTKEMFESKPETSFLKLSNQTSRFQNITDRFQSMVNCLYVEKHRVDEYADQLNISPGHLSDVVKETLGLSPKSIIDERILLEAKNLLTMSDLPVSQISNTLGFTEIAAFGKFFKKKEGVSPTEFRKNREMDKISPN